MLFFVRDNRTRRLKTGLIITTYFILFLFKIVICLLNEKLTLKNNLLAQLSDKYRGIGIEKSMKPLTVYLTVPVAFVLRDYSCPPHQSPLQLKQSITPLQISSPVYLMASPSMEARKQR